MDFGGLLQVFLALAPLARARFSSADWQPVRAAAMSLYDDAAASTPAAGEGGEMIIPDYQAPAAAGGAPAAAAASSMAGPTEDEFASRDAQGLTPLKQDGPRESEAEMVAKVRIDVHVRPLCPLGLLARRREEKSSRHLHMSRRRLAGRSRRRPAT